MTLKPYLYCACLAGTFALSGIALGAETLESVEKKLIEAAEKTKTMTAKMTMTLEMDQPSMKMKMKGEGTIETARRGEKILNRAEMTTTGTNKFGDQPEQKVEQKSLSIVDGEYAYNLTESNGMKTAAKMKVDPSQQKAVTKAMFEALRKDHDLKLLPEEKVDGRDTYVIQALPKKQEEGTTQKSTFWFDKGSAVMIKFVSEGKMGEGKSNTSVMVTNIKLDVDIKPDRFVFKAPDGVEVTDMTKLGEERSAAAGSGEPAKTESAKPAETTSEKKAEEKKEPPKEEKKKSLIPKIKLK